MHVKDRSASIPRRRRTFVAATGAVVLATGLVAAQTAFASHGLVSLPGSNFEIDTDANLKVDHASPSIDWASVSESRASDKATGQTDDSFGQGTKEDTAVPTVVSGSIPNNKSDLLSFGVYLETNPNGKFLNLFWTRVQEPTGTTNMDFEFNKSKTASANGVTPVRSEGDLLIQYDLTSGGTHPELFLSRWVTSGSSSQCEASNSVPCWGDRVNLSAAGDATGSINTSPIPAADSDGLGALSARTFGEAQLDFAALTGGSTACVSFGSAYLKSRSSDSFTAALKDFIAPINTNFSNCGSITIHKVTENGDSTFDYSTTGGLTPSTFSLANGGTQSYTSALAGSYTVTEAISSAQAADNWTLKSISCTTTGAGTSTSTDVPTKTATITLGADGTVDCTFTNHTKKNPTITTTLSGTSVDVGTAVHDSATLSGATSTAGGTVTYTVYTDSACTLGAQSAGTVTVTNGVVPDSDAITFNTAGDYYWQAVYSGDADNTTATSVCTEEHLVVNKKSPSASTAQTLLPNDSFTLSGGFNATGTVTFSLYPPSDATCQGTASYTQTVSLASDGTATTTNSSFYASAEGTWRWVVTYAGDSNNNGVTLACGTERFSIANS